MLHFKYCCHTTTRLHPAAAAEAPYKEEKEVKEEADGALVLSAKDQLTLSDYELPYIDEDDTEEEDQ